MPVIGVEQGVKVHAMSSMVAAAARLDRLPLASFHRRLLWIVGLSIFFDFFDAAMAGALVGGLLNSHWSTLRMNTLFLAASGVGGVAGNLIAGASADRFGRRMALRASLLLVAITTLVSAAAPSMSVLTALRFVSCVGIAAVPTVGFSLLSEFLPPQARGRWSSLGGTIANCATVCAALAGYILLPHGEWRWMFVIPGVACLVLCLISGTLPESPRWLEALGRQDEARQTMDEIERGVTASTKAVLPPIKANPDPVQRWPAGSLWRRPLVFRLLFGMGIALGTNVAIAGVLTWLPTILLKQGFTISNSLARNLLMTVGAPVGALLSALLADRYGRRPGIVVVAIAATVLAVVFSLTTTSVLSIPIGFTLLTALAFLVNIIYAVYLPELFPTTLRVQGCAAAAATTKFAFIFLPFAMASLLTRGGIVAAMGLIEACLLLVAVSVAVFGRETALKSLEVTSATAPGDKLQSARLH